MSCSPPLSKKQRVSPLEFSITIPKISLHSKLGVDASLIILSMLDARDFLKLSRVQTAWKHPFTSMCWNTPEGADKYARSMRATKETAASFFEFIKEYGIRRIVIKNAAPCYLKKMQYHPMLEQLSIQNSSDLNLKCFRRVKEQAIREISLDNVPKLTGEWFQEGFKFLSKLKIEQCEKINDEALNLISSKKTIQSLTIHSCGKITDLGVKCLASLEQLTELDLQPCLELTDQSLEYLKPIPFVQLNLWMCWKITKYGLNSLIKPLTTLTYRITSLSKDGFELISVKKIDNIFD